MTLLSSVKNNSTKNPTFTDVASMTPLKKHKQEVLSLKILNTFLVMPVKYDTSILGLAH